MEAIKSLETTWKCAAEVIEYFEENMRQNWSFLIHKKVNIIPFQIPSFFPW